MHNYLSNPYNHKMQNRDYYKFDKSKRTTKTGSKLLLDSKRYLNRHIIYKYNETHETIIQINRKNVTFDEYQKRPPYLIERRQPN